MPDSNLSAAQREAHAVARVNDPSFETYEISHSAIDPVYMVDAKAPIVATLETAETVTFEPVAIRAEWANQGENGVKSMTLTIDNVDRRIGQYMKAISNSQEEALLRYRPFLSIDLSEPQISEPIELTIEEVSTTVFEVTITARSPDIMNWDFPNEDFTNNRFPSLAG